MTGKDKTLKDLIAFCQMHYIKHHQGFENFTKSVKLPEAHIIDIESVRDLQRLIKYINKLNQDSTEKITYRVASGSDEAHSKLQRRYDTSFSMTPCMAANVIVRLVGPGFQRIDLVNSDKKIVRVGAGVQVGNLDRALYHRFKLHLPTSSLIPWPRFTGLVANGGHGTGRDQPGVAGLVTAITIMRPDGKIVKLSADTPDEKLKHQFEIIKACHLGLFGIVLDMEISCAEATKFRCVIETKNLAEFRDDIKNGVFQKHEYLSVMYTPTYRDNEGKITCPANVKLLRWERVPITTPNKGSCTEIEFAMQDIGMALNETFQVTDILAKYPALIPAFMQYFVSTTQVGEKDKTYVDDPPDIFHYQHAYPNSLVDADYLFNVSDDGHEILEAIDMVETKLRTLAKLGLYPIVYAIYLRYFKGTNGGLSPSAAGLNEHVCGMDFTTARGIPGFNEFIQQILPIFIEKFKAKPHWGKDVPLNLDYKKIYGKDFHEFMKVLKAWYADCDMQIENSPLLNEFFATILNIKPNNYLKTESHHESSFSAKDTQHKLKKILSSLEAKFDLLKNETGENLRTQIKSLIDEHRKHAKNPNTTFFSKPILKHHNEQLDVKSKKKR